MKTEPVKFETAKVGKGWGVSVSVGGEPALVLVTRGEAKAVDLVLELERLADGAVVQNEAKEDGACGGS